MVDTVPASPTDQLSDGLFSQTRFVRHHHHKQIVKALKNMWTVMALANSLLAAMSIVPLTIVPDSFKSTSESPSESTSVTDYQPKAAVKTAYGLFWILTIGCNLLALFMAITLLTYAVTAPNIFDLLGFKPETEDKNHSYIGIFVVFPYFITALGVLFLSVALAITAHAFYGLGICILAIVFFVVGFVIYALLVCAHCHYWQQYQKLYSHGEKGGINYKVRRHLPECEELQQNVTEVVTVKLDSESIQAMVNTLRPQQARAPSSCGTNAV